MQKENQYKVVKMSNNHSEVINTETYPDMDDTHEVFIHNVPEHMGSWTHIVDLDSFFTRMYKYYTCGGFMPTLVGYLFNIIQYAFIIWFMTFLIHCVDYPVLFNHSPNVVNHGNISFADIVYPNCVERIPFAWWTLLSVFIIVGVVRLVKFTYNLYHFYDIKLFYNNALKIQDFDLCWLNWSTILERVKKAQLELQMCIHKQEITELDIYQRILRFNNYLVAMINKKLLPLSFNVPFVGEVPFFTKGLKYNIELLLFYGPWSPWENCWHLRDSFKDASKKHLLARQLQKQITVLALLNLLLMPFIQAWQIIYLFFSYAEIVKRSPGSLTLRTWSLYSRLSLRHFNELDHELQERLIRAYKPATKYLGGFPSPVTTIIAKNVTFLAASVLGVLIALSIYDESVLNVDHMLTVITVLGIIVAATRTCIPEEGTAQRSSEELLIQILQQVHYLPPTWRGKAHTQGVAIHFQTLFQYRFVSLFMELISPILCPFILYSFRNHALDIVDFYRNFTLRILGIGDVCSFAQMDVHQHGHPDWNISTKRNFVNIVTQYNQAENGKLELSLAAFSCRNPNWRAQLPAHKQFLNDLKNGITIATQNFFTSSNLSLNMNQTMLHSFYIQNNIIPSPLSLPLDVGFDNILNEIEDEEDKIVIPDVPVPDLIPDKLENSANQENKMSINTLHLYDMHLAKISQQSNFWNSSVADCGLLLTTPSTSSYRPSAQMSPFSGENTPLLKKHAP